MSQNKNSVELTEEDLAKFDWLDLHKEMDKILSQETALDKFIRKSTENPLVPIGAATTSIVLFYGIWSFTKGRKKMSQYMMRSRVAAQGFTIAAIVGGYIYGGGKK